MAFAFDIGVEYKVPSREPDLRVLSPDGLDAAGINFVRLQWVDLTNTVRFRIMPVEYLRKLLASKRGGINIAVAVLGLVNLSLADGFPSMGEYLYVPDIRTLRPCPYEPGQASLMGWFQTKAPYGLPDGRSSSVEVPICPRTILKKIVDAVEKESQTKFLVGFESEFVLLKSTLPFQAVSNHAFSTSESLRSGNTATKVMNEIAKAVQASGIELQLYHGEAAPGQYEVVTGPLPPLESADALVHTREIIYNTAALYGLRATFAPKTTMTSTGSAAHAHISVHSTSPTAAPKSPEEMSHLERTFLAGVMEHLPALPALTLPTAASYQRVGDGVWSGGTYVCWGTENREAPVRLTNPRSPSSRRFELRFIDGTANPYLALAGIIAAGHDGIKRGLRLVEQDCPGPRTAAQMTEEERRALGITKRIPLSWEEGRKRFLEDQEIVGVFGEEMKERYLSVNKLLNEYLEGVAANDIKLQRLVEFY